jgi:hypothetical protein
VKLVPLAKPCFLSTAEFLAEFARTAAIRLWHTSAICPACEQKLRSQAA